MRSVKSHATTVFIGCAAVTFGVLSSGAALATPAGVRNLPACAETAGTGSVATSAGGYGCAEEGDLLDVRIGDVHATQPSVGYDEVYYKLGRYTLGKDEINKKFDDWCEANGQDEAEAAGPNARLDDPSSFTCTVPVGQETDKTIEPMKTVVIGPGGTPYLTDGHHTLTSFYETPDGGPNMHVRLRVAANLSDLDEAQFWSEMENRRWVWNRDVAGNTIPVEQLPTGVGLAQMADDKYRSAVYFGRDIGYEAGTTEFQEFYWGQWLRDSGAVDLSAWDANDLDSYLKTVEQITRAQAGLPRDQLVDSGRNAAELGAMKEWNDGKSADEGEFDKLSRPYSDDKPGKIAYAMEYKKGL